jgi:hypothetical protein
MQYGLQICTLKGLTRATILETIFSGRAQ